MGLCMRKGALAVEWFCSLRPVTQRIIRKHTDRKGSLAYTGAMSAVMSL